MYTCTCTCTYVRELWCRCVVDGENVSDLVLLELLLLLCTCRMRGQWFIKPAAMKGKMTGAHAPSLAAASTAQAYELLTVSLAVGISRFLTHKASDVEPVHYFIHVVTHLCVVFVLVELFCLLASY